MSEASVRQNAEGVSSATSQPQSRRHGLLAVAFDALAGTLTTYFVVAACSLYWLTAAGGALLARVFPRSLIERAPLAWLTGSSLLVAAATQTVPGFFPDYSNWREIGAELALWVTLGLFARSYLIFTDYPETFEGLKASIESRPLEKLISQHLNHPIDAIFTRIWLGNSLALIPLTTLLIIPSTVNYFVLVALGVAMLMAQFPHEIIDHTNIHTRVFQPRLDASPQARRVLKGLQLYFENVLSILVSRTPKFYFAQHVFVHHHEGNGPDDSQSTEPYDRTSFFDFARHAFRQGVHLVTGVAIWRYLKARGKDRPARQMMIGLGAWYVILIAIATFNPVASVVLFASRFLGGNVQSLVAFWQHGLVDPRDSTATAGNTIDFAGPQHGNLGNDFHVEHHDQPSRHWSKYYELYSRKTQAEGGHTAVVFHKEMFAPLAFVAALWRKDYDTIAASAHVHGLDRSDRKTVADEIRARTLPIGADVRTGVPYRIDDAWSRLMALAMPVRFKV